MQVSLFIVYHAEEMNIVREAMGSFGIVPLIVTYSTGPHTFRRFGSHGIEHQRVCDCYRQALCGSGWQT